MCTDWEADERSLMMKCEAINDFENNPLQSNWDDAILIWSGSNKEYDELKVQGHIIYR